MLDAGRCDAIESCEACPLGAFARERLGEWGWPDGNPRVAWRGEAAWRAGETVALVGMNPGKQEFLDRAYFCGPAGKALTTIIESTGRHRRDRLYVSNTFKCATPGQKELDLAVRDAINTHGDGPRTACLTEHLLVELASVKPRGIVLFGDPTYRAWQHAHALHVDPAAWQPPFAEARKLDPQSNELAVRIPDVAEPVPALISAHPSFGNLAREENRTRFLAFLDRLQ